MFMFCIFTTLVVACQEPNPENRTWQTPIELNETLHSIAQEHKEVTLETIGHSIGQVPIYAVIVARDGDIPIDHRSAILVVAGIDGIHVHGREVAVDLIEDLLKRKHAYTARLLEDHVLYIIPQVNPDATNHFFSAVKQERQNNLRPYDDDHDGFIDEDGADDLNGDGYITMMRVFDLEKATHLPNADDPRLDRTPTPFESGAASYVLYPEGIDDDGDGLYNEDGQGGVDINKNFMHGYQIHGPTSGPWQLSEPESMALISFVFDHQNIAAIMVYGQHDTLSKPWTEKGKDQAGAPKQLHEGDVELYAKVSELFGDVTKLKGSTQPSWDGSFVAWGYAQFGVPAFSTPLWSRPDPKNKDTDKEPSESEASDDSSSDEAEHLTPSGIGDISQETLDELLASAIAAGYPVSDEMMQEITPEDVEMYAKMSSINIRRIPTEKVNKATSTEDVKWLKYSDEVRQESGFVNWKPFHHPQLGQVEIGGWVPYFKTLPPKSELASITSRQADFLINLAIKLPQITMDEPVISKLGNGLWEVKVSVVNNGWLPSGTAMAKRNKRARPYVLRLDVPNLDIVSGQKIKRIWNLSGNGSRTWFKWIIKGTQNAPFQITLYSEKFGEDTIESKLSETKGGDV